MRKVSFFSRRKTHGFTLVEVLVFIVVSGILMSTILLGITAALRAAPHVHENVVALQTARRCMEWMLGQVRIAGYSALSCPNSATPSFCSAPSGYSVGVNVSCTTWNGDAYKTITVTVGGAGNAQLFTQVGEH
jgi:type II secretory pathway pseudopilin PulG